MRGSAVCLMLTTVMQMPASAVAQFQEPPTIMVSDADAVAREVAELRAALGSTNASQG